MAVVLVTGDRGFIASYLIPRLIEANHKVIGVDNYSKMGPIRRRFDDDTAFTHYAFDVRDKEKLDDVMKRHKVEVVIANAALIGGIRYFHDNARDIILQNTMITNSTVRSAIDNHVSQFIQISSSMVYEGATDFPVVEGDELEIPPPRSAYGFQKLHDEYVVRNSGLTYTIVRPFNAVGVGEATNPDKPGFSHVIPDLAWKVAKSLNNNTPIEIFGSGLQTRCYTHANDIAKGIVRCVLNEKAYNEDFNLVRYEPVTVLQIVRMLWSMMSGRGIDPLRDEELHRRIVHVDSFEHDIKRREGTSLKAWNVLNWQPIEDIQAIVTEVATDAALDNI